MHCYSRTKSQVVAFGGIRSQTTLQPSSSAFCCSFRPAREERERAGTYEGEEKNMTCQKKRKASPVPTPAGATELPAFVHQRRASTHTHT